MGIFNPTQEGGAAFVQPTADDSAANAIQGLTSLAGTVISAFAKPEQKPSASEINMEREDAAWSQLEKSFNEANAFDKAGRTSQAERRRKDAIVQASKYLPKERLNTFVMGQTGMDLSANLIDADQVRLEEVLKTPEGRMAVAAFDPNNFDSMAAWREAILTKTQGLAASKMRMADQKLSFDEKRPDRINYLSSKVDSIIGSKRLVDQTGVTLTTDQLTVASVDLQAERRALLADVARSGASQEDIKEELAILDSADAVVKMFMEVPEKDRNRVSATVTSALMKRLREKYDDAGVALIQELIKKDPGVLFAGQDKVREFVDTVLQPKPSMEAGPTDSSDLKRYSGKANILVEKLGFEHPETRKEWGNQADVSRARSAEQNIYKIDAAKGTWSLTSIDRLAKYAAAYPQEGMDLVDKTLAAVNGQKTAIESYFVSLADQYGLQFDRANKSFTLSTDTLLTNVRPEVRAQVKAAVEVAARQFYNGSVLDLVMDNGSLLTDGLAKQFAVNTNSSSGSMGNFRAIFRDRIEPYQKTLEHLDKVTRILPNPNGMAPVEDKVSSVQPDQTGDQTEDQSSFIDAAVDFGRRVLGALNPISSAAAATLPETIGTAESNQSYNAINRGTIGKKIIGPDLNATRTVERNGSQVTLPIQELTIGEIRSFHSIKDPNNKDRIFATGYYQARPSTFELWLNTRPDIKEDTVFSPELQDELGYYLYNVRRRAVGNYIKGQSNDLDEALLQLAQEWASFPIPYDITRDGKLYKKGESYYGGANKSHVSLAKATQALQESRQAYLDKFKNVPGPRPNPRSGDQYFDGPFRDGSAPAPRPSQDGSANIPVPPPRPSQGGRDNQYLDSPSNLPRESQVNASNIPVPPPRPAQDKITIGPGAEPEKQRQRNLEALGEEAKRYLAEAERTNDLAKWKEAAAKQRELIQGLLGQ